MIWALALPLATFLASAHAWPVFVLLAYGAGRVVCHQLPERSFHLWTHQMPVCARCTGLYLGAAAAAMAAGTLQPDPAAGARRARVVLLVAALPTVATLAYEWTTGDMPANAVRAASGLPLGAAVAWLIVKVN